LKRSGVVIALTADPEIILSRSAGRIGPCLGGDRQERSGTFRERAPAYAKADLTVDTSTRIDEVVDHLTGLLAPDRSTTRE
jgi:shikimate kinase